jgi:tetratricopeptide (TPR) repeat protein
MSDDAPRPGPSGDKKETKKEQKSLPEIAQELGVDLVVEGSVARAGDRVRVSAQLIDARRDEHLWARSYDRRVRDVLALQGEVATPIAREVQGALTPGQQSRLAQRRALDPEAYDLYLRGRHAWNLRTPQGFQDALRLFELAVQEDTTFALAYAGLADTYSLLGAWSQPGDNAAKAKAAATRALELDDGLAEALTSLAAVHHRAEGNVADAEREFQRALSLNGGYATAHQWYAILLGEEGRDGEATGHAQQAVALDPLSGTMHQTLGLEALFKELAALEPVPAAALARWHAATGDRAAALPMLERTMAIGPFAFQPLLADPAFDGLRSDPRFAALVRRAKAH